MRFLFALTLLSLGVGVVLQTAQVSNFEQPDVMIWSSEMAFGSPSVASVVVTHGGDPALADDCVHDREGCSLRGAIDLANRDGTPTRIRFSEHMIIELTRPLPPLVEPGTEILAELGKEIHVDGKGVAGTLFDITASDIRIEGLRLYGSGPNVPIIVVRGTQENVVIARNVIGDDDAPAGNCGQSDSSSAGIYLSGSSVAGSRHISITDNIVECIGGSPGDGVHVENREFFQASDGELRTSEAADNIVRFNRGHGVYLGRESGFVIANNLIHDNGDQGLVVADFNNDITGNSVR